MGRAYFDFVMLKQMKNLHKDVVYCSNTHKKSGCNRLQVYLTTNITIKETHFTLHCRTLPY